MTSFDNPNYLNMSWNKDPHTDAIKVEALEALSKDELIRLVIDSAGSTYAAIEDTYEAAKKHDEGSLHDSQFSKGYLLGLDHGNMFWSNKTNVIRKALWSAVLALPIGGCKDV